MIKSESNTVDNNEYILIHFFFNVFNFDYRSGLFTDESSIYDLGAQGLEDSDYLFIAEEYYKLNTEIFNYDQGMKSYYKILNKYWDNFIIKKIENCYGFKLCNIHLLPDIIATLKEKFPTKNWEDDTLFIIKTLDNQIDKSIKQELKTKAETNVIKLNIRKKLSREEILESCNEFLIAKELNISFSMAKEIANSNYDKKNIGRKFRAYIPNIQD